MTSIYSMAKSVAIWLGPEMNDSRRAINLLYFLGYGAVSSTGLSEMVQGSIGQQQLSALARLFDRDFWNRLWVVQEVLNAKSVSVLRVRER